MKRIIALLLAACTLLMLAGCGKKDRIMYKSVELEKFVKLTDYKAIKIDTSSKEFEEKYNETIKSDIENNGLYVKKTEGTVADGDTANIDYVGKKDGVAFEGGTAEGYDLEIGSGSFIDGFESGLIGKKIGDTVDLNLTFPEGYQSEELAGKAVVFTVTINYVKTEEAREPKDYFSELKFKSLADYEKDVKDRTVDTLIAELVVEKSEIKDYPKEDSEFLQGKVSEMFENQVQSYYGMTLDAYLTQNNMTKESFNSSLLEEQVYPMMDQTMPMYAIIDKEKIEIADDDIKNYIDKIVKEYDSDTITADTLKEYYGEYYFENMVANEKAIDAIKNYATIK